MPDSHLMLRWQEISTRFAVIQDPGARAMTRHAIRKHLGTLWRLRKSRAACKGAQQKDQAMTTPKSRPSIVHGESHSYPVLPLRDIVVFPHMIVPLFVGREKSIRALEEVMKNDALIMLATQKNAADDDPSPDSIYETGTLASVLQ